MKSMKRPQHISTIEREYADQWVTVEVTRESRNGKALAGVLLAHSPDEDEITRKHVRLVEQRSTADLYTFHAGPRIKPGTIVILACR